MLAYRYENRLFHRSQFVPRCVTPSSLFLRLISLAVALRRALHDNGVASRARPSNQLDKEAMSVKSADRSERKIRAYAVSLFDHTCPRVSSRTHDYFSLGREIAITNHRSSLLRKYCDGYRCVNITVTSYVKVNRPFPAGYARDSRRIWDEQGSFQRTVSKACARDNENRRRKTRETAVPPMVGCTRGEIDERGKGRKEKGRGERQRGRKRVVRERK